MKIKEMRIYSLKDTIGIDFQNNDELKPWIWYKKKFKPNGKLVEEINYPFPHNPMYSTTKITRTEERGDTIISTILNGKNEIASQSICVTKNKIRSCTHYRVATLNTSSFTKLEKPYILISTQDSIKNLRKNISIQVDGIRHDTLRTMENPLVYQMIDTNKVNPIIKSHKIDTIVINGLTVFGHLITQDQDTTELGYFSELKLNNNTSVRSKLFINKENNSIFKNETIWENDLSMHTIAYRYINSQWQINYIIKHQYNEYSDQILKIRDDYRDGKFSYRYVTYFEYEYY